MFYEDRLSSLPLPAPIIGGKSLSYAMGREMLDDYEDGGIDINDAGEGLLYQIWHAYVTENRYIWVHALTTGQKYQVLDVPGIKELSFTFDQNMQYCIAYEAARSEVSMYWYDSSIANYRTTNFGDTYDSMKVFLDDKRLRQRNRSDVICTYIRNYGSGTPGLYFRKQRDRFEIEYLLQEGITGPIYQFGMGNNWRLQWIL